MRSRANSESSALCSIRTGFRATAAVALALVVAACATKGVPVTGKDPKGLDAAYGQSETSISTGFASGKYIITVTYNDETNPGNTIAYTANTRTIKTGASLMGWSYSVDRGKTWTYGGKVSPPSGWAVLWGDPAITTSDAHYRYVFIANLAIPSSKMPANGINGSVIISGANSYIGGACIARSSDGGITFAAHKCVADKTKNNVPDSDKGHFYDGASMATSRDGEVYAAFLDVTSDEIDVWRAPDESADFKLLPSPFPNLAIYSHPRLRVNWANGDLYVAATATNNHIYINRYHNGQWGSPALASEQMEHYPCVEFEPNGCSLSGKLHLRTGPQFSFDIGAASNDEGTDAIRFLYTRKDPETKRLYVQGSFCPLSLQPGCWPAPEWGTTPGNLNTPGDQFSPTVAAWRGFIGLPPIWKTAYLDRDGSPFDAVTVKQGNLAYLPNGTRIYVPFSLIKDIPICPDLRGYWGDYDDLEHIGFNETSNVAEFLRTTTDSSLGCVYRWQYISNHQHIRGGVTS